MLVTGMIKVPTKFCGCYNRSAMKQHESKIEKAKKNCLRLLEECMSYYDKTVRHITVQLYVITLYNSMSHHYKTVCHITVQLYVTPLYNSMSCHDTTLCHVMIQIYVMS